MFLKGQKILLRLLLLLLATTSVQAAPRIPASEAEILERLPSRPGSPREVELRGLRAALAADPRDHDTAARLALKLFERANAEGDPRYIGYAQAALAPWPDAQAPADVLYARALLRQYRHDFAGALAGLQRVLELEPGHEGARAWRAAIFMVRADYAAAARECDALAGDELTRAGCSAYVEATTGRARPAYERLRRALAAEPDVGPRQALWILTRLAEMAWRLEDAAAAERHFRDALALRVEDNFLLAAYADFLLEKRRPREVVELLRERTRSDTLLLRLAIAQHALGLPEAEAGIRTLGERFAAAALRGEQLHLAEESRYRLELKGDARGALDAALENWKDQREPRDALAVLEAAVAARDARAAEPVLRWLKETGFESERLKKLARLLR